MLTQKNYDDVLDVVIAERFSWSLKEVRDLGDEDYRQVLAVMSGIGMAKAAK